MSARPLDRVTAGIQPPPGYFGPGDAMTARASLPASRLTVRGGSQVGQSFNLSGETTTIGRSSDNAVVLTDPTVSRHHARIYRQGSDYFLEDLGSTSGTMLNQTQVHGSERLTADSVIKFGNAELSFEGSGEPRTAATQVARQPGVGDATVVLGRAKGTAWLLVIKGVSQAGESFVLNGENHTIGRSPECSVRLDDQAVSRDHALIRRIDKQYVLFDLGSQGGVRVNGQTTGVGGVRIKERSQIVLGTCELGFSMVRGGPPQASPGGTVLLRQEPLGTLLVRSGPAAGQSISLVDDLVIGREPGQGGADLSDPSISRRHAMIRKTQDGYVIYDLGSANGSFVDGVKLAGRTLRDGDTIELGSTILKFGQA